MDIKRPIDDTAQNERSKYHITLGQLVEYLKQANPDKLVHISASSKSVASPHSYRGYYSDLALEPSDLDITTGRLLQELESVFGKTLKGYKGGDFKMTEKTPLWISPYGEAERLAIVDIVEDRESIKLVTKYIE